MTAHATCTRSACRTTLNAGNAWAHLDTGDSYCIACANNINYGTGGDGAIGRGEGRLVVPLAMLDEARATRAKWRKKRLQATFKQGVRAVWRQMRVNTDGDMSVLVDAWRVDDMTSMREIAKASNGRITVESDEQLRDGLIAVVWEIDADHAPRGMTNAPYRMLQKPSRKYLGSTTGVVWRGVVHDEIDATIPDIAIEFAGTCTHVGIYGPKGNELLCINIADPKPRVAPTDDFRTLLPRPVVSRAGRPTVAADGIVDSRFEAR